MKDYFCECLYFTVSRLSRLMNKMAEESFAKIGLSPTYAFLMMLVKDHPGISQKELSEQLHITPSTITRFIDKLEHKGLVQRRNEGKSVLIDPTENGLKLQDEIKQCWENLYNRYSEILGYQEGQNLTNLTHQASELLEEKM
jgi:DNA-binding MarR family transcriptional regulator